MLLDGGIWPLSRVLEVCMGETTLSTNPTQSIFGNYALGYCSVAPATR
jgi:hypothetical protein